MLILALAKDLQRQLGYFGKVDFGIAFEISQFLFEITLFIGIFLRVSFAVRGFGFCLAQGLQKLLFFADLVLFQPLLASLGIDGNYHILCKIKHTLEVAGGNIE